MRWTAKRRRQGVPEATLTARSRAGFFAYPRKKVQFRIFSRLVNDPLPLDAQRSADTSGIQKRPQDELFFGGLAGIAEPIGSRPVNAEEILWELAEIRIGTVIVLAM